MDPILTNDKSIEISNEMQVKSLAARNSAKNDYQWAVAEVAVVEEWAVKLFEAWLEIWDIQGFPRCHALYRSIYENQLRTLFAVRKSTFIGEGQLRKMRHISGHNSAIAGWFSREMDKLSSKWNRKVNVESRKCMYAARREQFTQLRASVPVSQATPTLALKRGGRKPLRNPAFQQLVAELWRANQGKSGRVDGDSLKRIAARLDESEHSKPSEYLEGKAAQSLKEHNRKYGHSKKKIMTWTALIESRNRQYREAMKKLLSRCACNIRKPVSG